MKPAKHIKQHYSIRKYSLGALVKKETETSKGKESKKTDDLVTGLAPNGRYTFTDRRAIQTEPKVDSTIVNYFDKGMPVYLRVVKDNDDKIDIILIIVLKQLGLFF